MFSIGFDLDGQPCAPNIAGCRSPYGNLGDEFFWTSLYESHGR